MAVAGLLLFLAISKKFEPNLLLAMAFGMFLINIPGAYNILYGTQGYDFTLNLAEFSGEQIEQLIQAGIINAEGVVGHLVNGEFVAWSGTLSELMKSLEITLSNSATVGQQTTAILDAIVKVANMPASVDAATFISNVTTNHTTIADFGLFYYLYKGVDWVLFPPLIFLGIGAMTDFGPLIANPKSLLLGAAAQIGIFVTFILASLFGFTGAEAASIGIIGGADGPTAIYLTSKLASHLMSSIAIAAYSYMALVPVIQPPIMKALTTKKERMIVMEQLRPVSKREKILFPIIVTGVVGIILPSSIPLLGMLMLGNLMKESGVVPRLAETAKNELINIITIFLGVTVGSKAYGNQFLNLETIKIIVLGVCAFGIATAGGVLVGKLMCKLSKGKINPLIGAAGVSAVPMAARVAQDVGKKENPNNYLLMHAMGPNVAGVIGSAVAAGALLAIFG
ncbi:MAG: sodium ion-translocating decarboxylase subunit beta [Clostridia bacterium]|nr:sodium ion-translocating decarboxylase subunit beta [Clostridia bacterium]